MWSNGLKLAMMAVAAWCTVTTGSTAVATTSSPPSAIALTAPQPFQEGLSAPLTLMRTWNGSKPGPTTVSLTPATSFGTGAGQLEPSSATSAVCQVTNATDVNFTAPAPTDSNQKCQLTLRAVADGLPTMDWQFGVGLTTADATTDVPDSPVLVIVHDHDPTFAFAPYPSVVQEGADIDLTLLRTGGLQDDLDPSYSITYSATKAASTKTVAFHNRATSGQIPVPNAQDGTYGGDQTVTVTVAGKPTSAASNVATFTIHDDDSVISMQSTAVGVERGQGLVDVLVTRSGDIDQRATVDYAIAPGTATLGRDYLPPETGTVVFPSGVATVPIRVALGASTASQARSFTVGLVGTEGENLDGAPGTARIVEPRGTQVTIAATPAPAPPVAPPVITPPTDPRVNGADVPPASPKLLAAIQAVSKPSGSKALPYVALPDAGKTIYLRVKVINSSSRAMDGAYALKLTAAGLKLQGPGASGATTSLAIDQLAPGAGVVRTIAAKTTSAKQAVISVGSDGMIPVTGPSVRLKRATFAVTLAPPSPIAHSADAKRDRVTVFTGTYAAPTCSGKPALFYRVAGTRFRNAEIAMKLKAGDGICTFTGRIHWTKAVFAYPRLVVQARVGSHTSGPITLRVDRRAASSVDRAVRTA
jgi:hypothetical protein